MKKPESDQEGEAHSSKATPNRISRLATSLKQIGDIEVTDWDFMELMHKDVSDLEVARSLRRLGRLRVTQWEFKDVIPAVNKFAHKEVDLVDVFKRTANYRVMEWDFRNILRHHEALEQSAVASEPLSPEELQSLIVRLKNFLQFVSVNLIDQPNHAQIKVAEIEPGVLRFKLILVRRDVAMVVGTGGHTAAAIRSLLQAVGRKHGLQVILRVLSHEEEALADEA